MVESMSKRKVVTIYETVRDEEYEMHDVLLEKEEEKMNTFIMMQLCFQKIEEISQERKDKFLEFLKK